MNIYAFLGAVVLCAAVQLLLCLRGKSFELRLMPVIVSGFGTAASAVAFLITKGFAVIIMGLLFAGLLLGAGLAWLVYFIVKHAQNNKK